MSTSAISLLNVLQVFGVANSFFLSGYSFSASHLGIPAINLAPASLRAKQFLVIYERGILVAPPLSAVSSLAWWFVAYSAPGSLLSGGEKALFAVAGALTFAFVPWTIVVMRSTNTRLGEIARVGKQENDGKVDEGEVKRLVKSWEQMNYVRAMLAMLGGVVGLLGVLR